MKVKEKELKTIKDQQEKINSILHQLGYLESQKHGLLHELAGVNQEDGTYTEIKEEEEEVAVSHV